MGVWGLGSRQDLLMPDLCWQKDSCFWGGGLLGTQMTAVAGHNILTPPGGASASLAWLQNSLKKLQERVPALGP